MVDKLLDEDDIIDLTDLLEDGESKKKGKGKKDDGAALNKLSNEPDSFDLGKEISMEYDVSVEEIDHTGESLDIDVSLSSSEEVALKQAGEGEGGNDLPEATQEEVELILEPEEKAVAAESKLTRDEEDILSLDIKEEELSPEIMEPEEPAAAPEEAILAEEAEIPAPVFPLKGKSGKKKAAASAPLELMEEEEITAPEKDLPTAETAEAIRAGITEDALMQLKQDLPVILEGVVKPLMTELVSEIISAAREQLPGIVEKVIREEIDKLKKLD